MVSAREIHLPSVSLLALLQISGAILSLLFLFLENLFQCLTASLSCSIQLGVFHLVLWIQQLPGSSEPLNSFNSSCSFSHLCWWLTGSHFAIPLLVCSMFVQWLLSFSVVCPAVTFKNTMKVEAWSSQHLQSPSKWENVVCIPKSFNSYVMVRLF